MMAGDSLPDLPSADFFAFESLLDQKERDKLAELREFLAAEIAPFAGDWWNKAEFPAHILPKLAALELSTPAQRGYSHLFAGLVIAEMTAGCRRDPGDHRRLRPHGAQSRLGRCRRHGNTGKAHFVRNRRGGRRRHRLGAERRKAVDRQRDVL